MKLVLVAAAAVSWAASVSAAETPASPAPEVDVMTVVPDPASVALPELTFTPSPEDEANYDKYYYFHRDGTGFEQALADLRDCDGLARGLTSGYKYQEAPYPYTYTMAGAVGGALGNALAAAIYGSAEKRRVRRANMRRCMGYKGYARYGLSKERWEPFNFEEGLTTKEESFRQARLAQQAKVASGPHPEGKELGL